jgi:hypothetical protein
LYDLNLGDGRLVDTSKQEQLSEHIIVLVGIEHLIVFSFLLLGKEISLL